MRAICHAHRSGQDVGRIERREQREGSRRFVNRLGELHVPPNSHSKQLLADDLVVSVVSLHLLFRYFCAGAKKRRQDALNILTRRFGRDEVLGRAA